MARVQKVINLILDVPYEGLLFAVTIPWSSMLRTSVVLEAVHGMRANHIDDDDEFDYRMRLVGEVLASLIQSGQTRLEVDEIYKAMYARRGAVSLCICPSYVYCEAEVTACKTG